MAEAKLNKDYAIRHCGVGAIMLALMGWLIYDGAFGWPKVNEDFAKVRPTLRDYTQNGLPKEFLDIRSKEIDFSKSIPPEGWFIIPSNDPNAPYLLKIVFDKFNVDVPKKLVNDLGEITTPAGNDMESVRQRVEKALEVFDKDIYSKEKINQQFYMAVLFFIFAVLAFYAVISKRNINYFVDDNGFSGSGFNNKSYTWDQVKSVDWSKWQDKGIVTIAITNGPRFKLDGWHFAGMRPIAEIIAKHFPMPEKE